ARAAIGNATAEIGKGLGVVGVEVSNESRERRKVVAKRAVGSFDYCTIDRRSWRCRDRRAVWLESALDCDHRVVHRSGDVSHVNVAFRLERARPHDRVLDDLVPLLDGVAWRQSS